MNASHPDHPYHIRRRTAASARWIAMLAMRQQGRKYREIASAFGVRIDLAFRCVQKAVSLALSSRSTERQPLHSIGVGSGPSAGEH